MTEWRFLLDENIEPKTVRYLEKEGIEAEHVRDVLGQGADDERDILPYTRTEDRVVVTSDVADFAVVEGVDVVLLYDNTTPAHRTAAGLVALVDAYPTLRSRGWRNSTPGYRDGRRHRPRIRTSAPTDSNPSSPPRASVGKATA